MVFNILMMFPRLIYRHLTASIAMVAILLLFVAPLVSKMLTEQHISHHSMMVATTTAAEHLSEQANHQRFMADPSAMLVGGYACGYCEFLVHMPLFIGFSCFFIWLILLNLHLSARPLMIDVVVRRVATFHSPRAPPAPHNMPKIIRIA